jgi:predicted Ser/Thr protein kinase
VLQIRPAIVNDTVYATTLGANLLIINSDYTMTVDRSGTQDVFFQSFLYKGTDIYITAGIFLPLLYYTTIYSYNIQTRVWQTELFPESYTTLAMALTGDFLVRIATFVLRKKKKNKKSSNTLGLENQYGAWFVDFSQIKFGEQLGQGANGQVFKGTWKNTTVALKVSVTTANSSVIRELELMMQLRPHPNVVQLLGFSVHPETESIILIIEYCNGGSLDKILYQSGNEISSELQHQWMLGIAKGLSHLHSNNIVHRDVAARNVLLHQNEVKITDFGMSRLVGEEKRRGTTKSELGPIRWMAPESLKERQYSTKSGKFSFF